MNSLAPPKKTGCNGHAALKTLTTSQVLRRAARKINGTFGSEQLCTWRYLPGICRIQTRLPELARKLSQRSRTRLVGWSVNGGYLRIFQEKIAFWRAKNLVTRYVAATNGAFSDHASPPPASKSGSGQ